MNVFPQLIPEPTDHARSASPLVSGLAELDALLGGGLTWGTTTLFIGPAGSGKSTVMAQYLCGAANPNSKAVLFLFDERQATFLARADALGMHASERIEAGYLVIEQVEPGAASPGEFSHRVKSYTDNGFRLVGIDTLNGYLNAIPPTDEPIVRMHELLSFLNERGAATMIALAQHGMLGAMMPVPLDVSYLADTIVLHRFFEAGGAVRKAISVVKKRTGAHENSIRELLFGRDRVQVGHPLKEFQGVLTGVPQYTGPSRPLLDNDDAAQQR